MYRIALVQNQSEMAHYGYADARPLVEELGYCADLFTADNIDALAGILARRQHDAVVLASNALNDKTIRSETAKTEFVSAFRAWIGEGKGLLCLHQLRLAGLSDARLPFLPEALAAVRPVVRPKDEHSADGTIVVPSGAADHIALLYPNSIEPASVARQALEFRSLPGLYWHYWTDASFAEWDALLVDPQGDGADRDLLLAAKETSSWRILLSALTLDWQKQRDLLQNVLAFVVEGRHSTAVLRNRASASSGFDFLLGTLGARKFPFQQYEVDQPLDRLSQHLANGVHTTLLLGPQAPLDAVEAPTRETIDARMRSGQLKVIAIESPARGIRRFSVAGRERYAARLFQLAELRINGELMTGYVDGSFWSTAETLQVLEAMPHARTDYGAAVERALAEADEHDRSGSYDEVFGVTCALYWMRATYLSADHKNTLASAAWLRSHIAIFEDREKALAYTTFDSVGALAPKERDALRRLVSGLNVEALSEMDIIVFIRAAIVVAAHSALPALIDALARKQEHGAWVGLATTATAVSVLLDARACAKEQSWYPASRSTIDRMVFTAIIHIQDALERSLVAASPESYPWDGKASTTVKCLQAWLRFDEMLDLPVYELVDTLQKRDQVSKALAAGTTGLAVLEQLRGENRRLGDDLSKASSALSDAQQVAAHAIRWERAARGFLLISILLTYAMGAVLWSAQQMASSGGAGSLLRGAFVSHWPFHIGIIAAVAAALVLPWRKWFHF